MSSNIEFKWRHFEKTIILLIVRCHLSYSLSYRNVEEMMLERGIQVDHSTLNRGVIHYKTLLENEFRKKFKRQTATSSHMDETYIKVKGA